MKVIPIVTCIALLLFLNSCKVKEQSVQFDVPSFTEQLENISDSTRVGGILVRNLFKSQILAHKQSEYDGSIIVEKVYKPHQDLWDNCYGMIFGDENASKFNTEEGMIAWNKGLYPKNQILFDHRAKQLVDMNLDSILTATLDKFDKMVPHKVESTISILFTPISGIIFGGCENDQFALELNYEDLDLNYTIINGLPHEMNHLAYDPLRENDPKENTCLRQTIDEGFACYFTWVFFNKEIPKYEAVENMTKAEWNWYVEHEKELYQKLNQYFDDENDNNPLMRNDKLQLFKDAPKSLNYWLGFRIVDMYVEKHGADSWKDIYEMDVQVVLDKSGYAKYIAQLN